MGKKATQLGGGCTALFGLPFLGAGVGILIYAGLCWKTYFESSSWKRVPARIESVKLETHSDSESTTYSVNCSYSYEFGGRTYAGTRVGIMGGASSDYKTHRRRYDVLKEHMDREKPCPALVDPADPGRAILFRKPSVFMYVLVPFGLVFFGAGAGLIAGGISSLAKSKKRKELTEELGGRPWLFREDWREMLVRASAWKRLATAWAAGVGLPVFVSIFVIVSGDAPFWAKVLIGVFVVIAALAFLGAVLLTVRLLVHGVPELALTELPIVPGKRMIAAIRTKKPIDAARAELVLTCTETRGGKHARVKDLFKKELAVDEAAMRTDADRTLLPVTVEIPADLPDRKDGAEHSVWWKLEVRARAFPVSLKAAFDLPVFRAEESEVRKRGE